MMICEKYTNRMLSPHCGLLFLGYGLLWCKLSPHLQLSSIDTLRLQREVHMQTAQRIRCLCIDAMFST